MTQVKAHLMEKHCNWLFPGNSPCFSWLSKETLWPLRYLETIFSQIIKICTPVNPGSEPPLPDLLYLWPNWQSILSSGLLAFVLIKRNEVLSPPVCVETKSCILHPLSFINLLGMWCLSTDKFVLRLMKVSVTEFSWFSLMPKFEKDFEDHQHIDCEQLQCRQTMMTHYLALMSSQEHFPRTCW